MAEPNETGSTSLPEPMPSPLDLSDIDVAMREAMAHPEGEPEPTAAPAPTPRTEDDADVNDADEETDEDGEASGSEPAQQAPDETEGSREAEEAGTETDPERLSRRGRAKLFRRLTDNLQESHRQYGEVKAELDGMKAVLAQRDEEWGRLVGTPEAYEEAKSQAAEGDTRARERVKEYDFWRAYELPIKLRGLKAINDQIAKDLGDTLFTLPGMDNETRHRFSKATSPVEALSIVHEAAYKAARAEVATDMDKLRKENERLKTQLGVSRTRTIASAPQPTAGQGAAPNGTLSRLVDENGFPTEEAIAAAKRGEMATLGA